MSAPEAAARTGVTPSIQISEQRKSSIAGVPIRVAGLVLVAGGIKLLTVHHNAAALGGGLAAVLVGALALAGLTPVSPGQARVVALFGRYLGTVRDTGLQWVNPFTARKQFSVRIRNHETTTLKVNDAAGNPIEMAAVVVWQVSDTAKAAYAVDDVRTFVTIQAETAVRHIAGQYPYDSRGTDRTSLRDSADRITAELSAELSARVAVAGVSVVESRITRLSYASEIAQAMLRRQQADAIVAARERLVEGAVGMVRTALRQISEDELVELDEERKASMVSNLLVVLCGDQPAQPIVNAGTLYQ